MVLAPLARVGLKAWGMAMCRDLSILRLGWAGIVLGMVALSRGPAAYAQEEPQAKLRLELMTAAVRSLELEPPESRSKPAFTFVSKPLLRYSDPTRGRSVTDKEERHARVKA